MAYGPHISVASTNLACDSIVDQLDSAAGTLKVFDGTMPAECADADAGTVLATITLPTPAFGAASNGQAAKSGTWEDTSADATGTAQYFRMYLNGGSCMAQGTCGTSGCDLNFNSVSISAGATVTITGFTMTVPKNPD